MAAREADGSQIDGTGSRTQGKSHVTVRETEGSKRDIWESERHMAVRDRME